jgi:cytochrome c biogenesis protein CcmG/thiol:disulfide interchange protein DsbE
LLIFLLLAIFLWKGLHEDPSQLPSPLLNKPFPTFAAYTLLDSHKLIDQRQFLGHITLLNIWASWCISCHVEHDTLMTISRSGIVDLAGLNYKDQRDAAIQWLKKAGNPYSQIIYDPEGKIALNLGVYGTPETFLIDPKGIIRYKYVGPITSEVWLQDVMPQIQQLERKLK